MPLNPSASSRTTAPRSIIRVQWSGTCTIKERVRRLRMPHPLSVGGPQPVRLHHSGAIGIIRSSKCSWALSASASIPRAKPDDGHSRNDVLNALEEGRSPILLTERRDHLEYFEAQLRPAARNLVVLRGGMGAKQRREATERIAAIPPNEERLVLATGRYIGEGFDDARLDTLFLTLPVSWKGTLVQYAGRLHRSHEGKREVRIFDYADREVPILARMFERRLRGYRAIGYEQRELPAGYEGVPDDPIIEWDEGALSTFKDSI